MRENSQIPVYAIVICLLILAIICLHYMADGISSSIKSKVGINKSMTEEGAAVAIPDTSVAMEVKPVTSQALTAADSSRPIPIKSVALTPEHPTTRDDIKAVLSFDSEPFMPQQYEYRWYVNNVRVPDVDEDTLSPACFKNKDSIFVDVTPLVDGKRGKICRSTSRIIDNLYPSLTMKQGINKVADKVIEIQLIGSDPAGSKITYALEAPFLEGMTIDKNTGKIIWEPANFVPGQYNFGASAANSDGSKVTGTFQFSIGGQPQD
ncbi:MAG: Ig domain-containing protein [Dissulfurispiraceae bacterium]|jgi:hypothetical protein